MGLKGVALGQSPRREVEALVLATLEGLARDGFPAAAVEASLNTVCREGWTRKKALARALSLHGASSVTTRACPRLGLRQRPSIQCLVSLHLSWYICLAWEMAWH